MITHTGSILIVEDFADDVTMLQTVLDKAGVLNPVEVAWCSGRNWVSHANHSIPRFSQISSSWSYSLGFKITGYERSPTS
jgi:hypothetical protein